MQCRYLLLQVTGHIAELHRGEAIKLAKQQNWIDCAGQWTKAHDLLNGAIAELELFVCAVVEGAHGRVGTPLRDGHDGPQVHKVNDIIKLMHDHTAEEHSRAVKKMEQMLAKLQARLQPMLRDRYVCTNMHTCKHLMSTPCTHRDAVRNLWGEDKWRTNPQPKMTFADRRRQLEEMIKDLAQALSIVSSLQLRDMPLHPER
jgi:hypothetical protein